nr:MAG TPA_asm: hypothetical protein [Caudoviricetes sp.]
MRFLPLGETLPPNIKKEARSFVKPCPFSCPYVPQSGVEWRFQCSLRYTSYRYCYWYGLQRFTPDYQHVARMQM